MPRITILHNLMEISSSRRPGVAAVLDPVPVPSPTPRVGSVMPDQEAFFPFTRPAFLSSLTLDANPLAPTDQGQHPLRWRNAKVASANAALRAYILSGPNRTSRAKFKFPSDDKVGAAAWDELAALIDGAEFLDRIDAYLDSLNVGFTHVLEVHEKCPEPKSALIDDHLLTFLFGDTPQLNEYERKEAKSWIKGDVTQRVVQRWQRKFKRDYGHINKRIQKNDEEYEKLKILKANEMQLKPLRRYVAETARIWKLLEKRGWKGTDRTRELYSERLDRVAHALGMHMDPAKKARLPTIFLSALSKITAEDRDAFQEALSSYLEPDMDSIDLADVRDFAGAECAALPCSAEELGKKTEQELLDLLGLHAERSIPGVAKWYSAKPDFNSFSLERDKWKQAVADADNGLETSGMKRFQILRHQLAGIARMLELAMQGLPILLLDDVGLGKTIQLLMLVAMIAFYRDFKSRSGSFPGKFKSYHFKGSNPSCTGQASTCKVERDADGKAHDGNFPNLPSMITCPPTLVEQWVAQAHMFLLNSAFTVQPYTSAGPAQRRVFFSKHVHCPDSVFRQLGDSKWLIVASTSALVIDHAAVLGDAKASTLSQTIPYDELDANADSIYAMRFNVMAHDELHCARNAKSNVFHAIRRGSQQATIPIGATATPIVTTVADVVSIGRALRHPNFVGRDNAIEIAAILSKSRSAQRRAAKQTDSLSKLGKAQRFAQAMRTMEDNMLDEDIVKSVALYAHDFGKRFDGSCIRRTQKDVNTMGKLHPIQVITALLVMYPREQEAQDEAIRKLLQDALGEAAPDSVMAQDFYLPFRHLAFHYLALNATRRLTFPVDEAEFKQDPSAKLDRGTHLIKNHLNDRQLPPQVYENGAWRNGEWDPPLEPGETARNPALPQKIVIYVYFPRNNGILIRTLRVHGIQDIFVIGGSVNVAARGKIANDFRNHPTSAVLIVSSVASAGLNLQEADILIIMDPTWSAQDEAQLRGRIWRHGQTSRTIAYRMVLSSSADVIMFSIAGPKEVALTGFTGDSSLMLQMLHKIHAEEGSEKAVMESILENFREELLLNKLPYIEDDTLPLINISAVQVDMEPINATLKETSLKPQTVAGRHMAGRAPISIAGRAPLRIAAPPSSSLSAEEIATKKNPLDISFQAGALMFLDRMIPRAIPPPRRFSLAAAPGSTDSTQDVHVADHIADMSAAPLSAQWQKHLAAAAASPPPAGKKKTVLDRPASPVIEEQDIVPDPGALIRLPSPVEEEEEEEVPADPMLSPPPLGMEGSPQLGMEEWEEMNADKDANDSDAPEIEDQDKDQDSDAEFGKAFVRPRPIQRLNMPKSSEPGSSSKSSPRANKSSAMVQPIRKPRKAVDRAEDNDSDSSSSSLRGSTSSRPPIAPPRKHFTFDDDPRVHHRPDLDNGRIKRRPPVLGTSLVPPQEPAKSASRTSEKSKLKTAASKTKASEKSQKEMSKSSRSKASGSNSRVEG